MANSTFDINQWLEKIGFGRFHVFALLVFVVKAKSLKNHQLLKSVMLNMFKKFRAIIMGLVSIV